MRVVGTAGHVDHGKSSLVSALTGINPDRLKEEKDREMTIELGFAWLSLPDGQEVGIVDVPGHRDFIENMLAGVGGIDAALFVVAADEGVMPQTREHLAILDLLQVQGGIVVLTKVDLVDDPEWLDLVELDLRLILKGTVLENSPIVRVSAKTGAGLEDLKRALATCLEGKPTRPDLGRARLPIDRIFSITGFGTVVTGTLIDGHLSLGDEVVILPSGLKGRIRGLQTHKKLEKKAVPGSRTAVNLNGIEVDDIKRGDVLASPGCYKPTTRLDVHFRLLRDAAAEITHNMEVKYYSGAAEVQGRIRLLGTEKLLQGGEGWLQLELDAPVTAVIGDRYILRRPSPGETLGGGVVVDPHPERRHKRFAPEIIDKLESLLVGSPADKLLQVSLTTGPLTAGELVVRARLDAMQGKTGIEELIRDGKLIVLDPGEQKNEDEWLLIAEGLLGPLTEKATKIISQFHQDFPLRAGMNKEELKSRLKLPGQVFNATFRTWVQDLTLVDVKGMAALPSHKIQFNAQQAKLVTVLEERFSEAPYSPPKIKECKDLVGDEVYTTLIQMGRLTPVSNDVVFRTDDFEKMVGLVKGHFEKKDQLTVIDLRDQLNTSRVYVLAFLEYLDSMGMTVRMGDYRVLKTGKH